MCTIIILLLKMRSAVLKITFLKASTMSVVFALFNISVKMHFTMNQFKSQCGFENRAHIS